MMSEDKINKIKNHLELKILNSASGKIEKFEPIDENNVKMYVCGPTVYDRAHIGNFRSVVIYDILFRVLSYIYPKITYVQNITDIDDKIIKAAKDKAISIFKLTEEMENFYNDDVKFLHCLSPTIQPKATDNIKEIIEIIQLLINKKHAYESQGHVLFDVKTYKDYGKLSNRTLDEMLAGARIEIAPYKKNAEDFVLWKPTDVSENAEYAFDSPWGKGRPGWHIECSAMSTKYLGKNFDIHGGGIDLIFPHHENEMTQTCSAYGIKDYVKYWVHNGFLKVDGQKMSKSLGNFITLSDLRKKNISGNVMRYFYLMSHYHKPSDFSEKALYDAEKAIAKLNLTMHKAAAECKIDYTSISENKLKELSADIVIILCDNLNTPQALAYLHKLNEEITKCINNKQIEDCNLKAEKLYACYNFLGFALEENSITTINNEDEKIPEDIIKLAELRQIAKQNKEWEKADDLRNKITLMGYSIIDQKNGYRILKNV